MHTSYRISVKLTQDYFSTPGIQTKMPLYTCEKCAKVFKQKSGYTDHKAKKMDCSTGINAVIEAKVEEKVKEVMRARVAGAEVTKETLPAFFEDLHNLLWNKAGLNPERALEHMTFFFAYRLIEQQADTLNLPQECRWSYIASLRSENDLFETIKKGVSSFRAKPKTKPFFKPHEIQKADIVYDIVHHINRIPLATLQETDTLGDIFEYMLGRGMSTMSDEGQYFTNRAICKLAFKLAYEIKAGVLRRPDGSLCTFADWFCGTGGFPAEFVKGVNAQINGVDWKRDSGSIYCQDMNLSSVTTTLLNMLILTGVPFSAEKIRSGNSFTDPITRGATAPFPGLTIDYCFMNPPYGGDKTKGKDYKFTYSKKVKGEDGSTAMKYFVNQDIQSIGIEDDDKVSAGVQLGMATLSADGGVACIVLPQGFFFGASKKAVELRKRIAEEYSISHVVDIASGAFANTGTKTSMIVFQRGVGATRTVCFIGMDEKVLAECTLADLRSKNYSLNYKLYVQNGTAAAAALDEGFKMMSLGDIVDIHFGERITKKEHIGTAYPVYGGGNDTFRTDKKNREGVTCKVSRFGMSEHNCVQIIHGDYWLMDSGFTVVAKEGVALNSYVWNWLLYNKKSVFQCGRATAQMNIDMDQFRAIQIPVPSLEKQRKIAEAIDGWSSLAQQETEALGVLEKQMVFYVKEMGSGKAPVRLGDVCEFKAGKGLTKEVLAGGDVPVIGGGVAPMGHHNVHNKEAFTPVIALVGSAGNVARYPVRTWITNNGITAHPKEAGAGAERLGEDTLYYLLKGLEADIKAYAEGTAQPKLSTSGVLNIQVQVPSVAEQEELHADFDEIRHKHAKIAQYKKKAQDAIQRLIPGTCGQ